MRFLQKYFLIALNVFRKIPYPKKRSEQTAWLSLLTVDNLEETKEEAKAEAERAKAGMGGEGCGHRGKGCGDYGA